MSTPAGGMTLGAYLKDRRTRLDPAACGLPGTRRRTLGLRREEVALRAHISPAWYTWLEQGRGGAASPQVLDRFRPHKWPIFLITLYAPKSFSDHT